MGAVPARSHTAVPRAQFITYPRLTQRAMLVRSAGVDLRVNDPHLSTAGWTAFHFAADRHHVACAVALLHAGASWQMPAQSHDGRRPRVPDEVKQKIRCAGSTVYLTS